MAARRWMLPGALVLVLGSAMPVWAAETSPVSKVPSNVAELRSLQQRVQEMVKKVMPCTVGVQIGRSAGSGVIVSEDGYVLTAGHVSGKPGQEAILIFPDGRHVKGTTLGANIGIDSGLIKITEDGKWPFVEMGESARLVKGQWCFSLGHPGGYRAGRNPVLRVGRIVNPTEKSIQTDCTLVGGDSGGPLFDLEGRVIGIHSRIGLPITFNIHVPVDSYRKTWERLARGETWGSVFTASRQSPPRPERKTPVPTIQGVEYLFVHGALVIREIKSGSIAEKAGLKEYDQLSTIEGQAISTLEDVNKVLSQKKAGQEITLEILRGEQKLKLKVQLSEPRS